MRIEKNEAKFVLLSTQRSGSTWVIDKLNRLPNANVYGELLLRTERTWDAGSLDFPRFIEAENTEATVPVRPFTMWAYLEELYNKPGLTGFKLMYSAIRQYPEVLYYLVRHRIKVVHLVRENYLNMLISSDIRMKTGQPHLQKSGGSQAPDHPQIVLPLDTLLDRLRHLQRKSTLVRSALQVSGLSCMEITYETLRDDNERFEEIYDFLNVDSGDERPKSSLRKIRTGGHRETIINYDEVRDLLSASEFKNLLEQ